MSEQEARELAERRAEARAARDFAAADQLREEIAALGYEVVDSPDGFDLQPIETAAGPTVTRIHPELVESLLDQEPRFDFSVHWLVQGWPEDVLRGVRSFERYAGAYSVQQVVVDAVGTHPSFFPSSVEEVPLEDDFGWGADRNAGLRRAAGRIVIVVDGSIEATGDVFTPLAEALAEPAVGLAGPFGIVTDDMREFSESDGPDVDAVEGYLMAFRREVLDEAGMFDEKFRFYRSADIEYSFRVKDTGRRAVVASLPVRKHEHRMWANTPEKERARLSKRNFYRFLERWRGRMDLTVKGG